MNIYERTTYLLDSEEVWKMQQGIVFVNRLTLIRKLSSLDGYNSYPTEEDKGKAEKIRKILSSNSDKYVPMECTDIRALLDKEDLCLISLRSRQLSNKN